MLMLPRLIFVFAACAALSLGCSDKKTAEETHNDAPRIGSGLFRMKVLSPTCFFLKKLATPHSNAFEPW